MPVFLLALLLALSARTLLAQTGSFVARLGSDTLHVERFTVLGPRWEGIVVTRAPTARITRWTADLDPAGRFARYEAVTTGGDGRPVTGVPERVLMRWIADTLIREVITQGERVDHRLAVRPGTIPGPTVPYLGTSFLLWEQGFRLARRTSADSSGARRIPQLTTVTRQLSPSLVRFWEITRDSAEADYFGVARSGWAFDSMGALLRADWRATTYRYQVERTAALDVESLARAWRAEEVAGRGIGVMSPRDSVRGTLGPLEIIVRYGRPARRGRTIWGEVVPWDSIWRLGADMATQLELSVDAVVGGTVVPAGRYSLWMLPRSSGTSSLVVNRQAQLFGTQYDPQRDLARLPLTRTRRDVPVERLTLSIDDGRLVIRWGELEWAVSVAPK